VTSCWGGRLLHWEEDPDEDTINEHRQHRSGSAGDVLCMAVGLPGRLAAGEPFTMFAEVSHRHTHAHADQTGGMSLVQHRRPDIVSQLG